MARFVLVVLLVMVGALVVALYFDHRGKRDALFDHLRSAFLHGAPLAGYSRAAAVVEVVHPRGLRFRAPASWTIAMAEERGPASSAPAGGRHVRVEVLDLEGRVPGSLQDAVARLAARGPRSVEDLPGGRALVKSVDPVRGRDGLLASYVFRLGRATPGGLQVASFIMALPAETAAEVIPQSDLAILDRAVREATFGEPPPAA